MAVIKHVTLAFLGDLMLGRGISRELGERSPHWFWGDVLPILREADAVLANLESPITTCNARWKQSWKIFHFRADPAAIGILECGNVRFVCLANNHMLDYGERGLLDTLQALDGVAATDNMPTFAAGLDRPGTNFVEIADKPTNLEWIDRSVNESRQAGADLVVLSLHWGPNMRVAPSQRFRRFAHAVIERGVDVIHGHSAHVVQAVERYKRGIILYDVGNFIDDYWKFPFRKTTWTFVFLLDIEANRPARLRLVPVEIHSAPLGLATGAPYKAIRKRMTSLCATVGTPVIDTPQALEVPIA
jgi:poly-gamma-glutamate synthesis protein (capsule biosynthesis protein)